MEEVEVVEVVVDNRVNKIAVAKELDLQSIPKTSQKNHFIQEKKVIIVSVLHQTKADKVILVVGRYINIKGYLINKKSNAWRMKLTSNNKLSKYWKGRMKKFNNKSKLISFLFLTYQLKKTILRKSISSTDSLSNKKEKGLKNQWWTQQYKWLLKKYQ